MYYLYIIYSNTRDKYYTGHTNDIEGRIRRHNTDHRGFTGKVSDWKLYYAEEFPNKTDAYKREREIKGWKSRIRIESLVI